MEPRSDREPFAVCFHSLSISDPSVYHIVYGSRIGRNFIALACPTVILYRRVAGLAFSGLPDTGLLHGDCGSQSVR